MRSPRTSSAVLCVSLVVVLAACTTAGSPSSSAPPSAEPTEVAPSESAAAESVSASPSPASGPTLGPGEALEIYLVLAAGRAYLTNERILIPYAEEVIPERSDNRVTFQLSSWEELNLSGAEVLRLVRDGQVDMGISPLGIVAQDLPALEMFDLTGLNPEIEQAREVLDASRATINDLLEPLGLRSLAFTPAPAQNIFCNVPIGGLADLAGKRVRTPTASLGALVEANGGQSVSLAFGEVYSALDTGAIDCAVAGTATANSFSWFEVTTHVLALPLSWAIEGPYVSLAWWDSLPADVQAFLEDTWEEIGDQGWELGALLTEDGNECNAGLDACEFGTKAPPDQALTIVEPSEADRELLQRLAAEFILPNFVERCGQECGDLYTEVVAPITGVEIAAP
jgi:TRAP-type transport system periplasmic protein